MSHSASFALLTYASCWIKCHEPAIFQCALLNSQPLGFYSPSQLVQDAKRSGVKVRPVDVTISHWDCTLEERDGYQGDASGQPIVRLGLRVVHGLSSAGAENIALARAVKPLFSGRRLPIVERNDASLLRTSSRPAMSRKRSRVRCA